MNNIQKFLSQLSCAAIIQNPKNRRYLTGFSSSDGVLLICEKPYLLLDFRYAESARIKKQQGIIPAEIEIICPERSFFTEVLQIMQKCDCKTLAFEENYVTFKAYKDMCKALDGIHLIPLENAVEKLRQIKSEDELKKIKAAQEITDSAFEHILGFISRDRTETEIAAEIDHYFRQNGAFTAFDTICVSGAKSSLPHGVPENIPITPNGFLTMDFGACLDGYCSDMTRTVVVGKADEKMKSVYSTVLEAQDAALSVIHGGIIGKEADSAARDVIYNAGYKGCFGHSLGHSLGLDIHESPNFSPKNEFPVPSGSVLSVEPGIYIEGLYGVRIEDIVYLTDEGCINLTRSTKKLIEL
ncbi:MAG: aminopeptidase P family protein [Ruminococcaceae bacterium]|nr:aminopeptidase P family protein [Oscillospiraceae bacterium]